MGRKKKVYESEGDKQSMKRLTKNHKKFMASRPFAAAVVKNDNPKGKADFESLLLKAVTPQQA